jgi:hypothetical protein
MWHGETEQRVALWRALPTVAPDFGDANELHVQ